MRRSTWRLRSCATSGEHAPWAYRTRDKSVSSPFLYYPAKGCCSLTARSFLPAKGAGGVCFQHCDARVRAAPARCRQPQTQPLSHSQPPSATAVRSVCWHGALFVFCQWACYPGACKVFGRLAHQHEAYIAAAGREVRRLRDEEGSRFACGELLHQRYLLQRLLGKGGFSEVFQVRAPCRQACALSRQSCSWMPRRNALPAVYTGPGHLGSTSCFQQEAKLLSDACAISAMSGTVPWHYQESPLLDARSDAEGPSSQAHDSSRGAWLTSTPGPPRCKAGR